jgi:transposase
MPEPLAVIRGRAAAHERELDAKRFYLSTNEVAARLGVSASTVRDIPFDDLPFLELGNGAKHKTRRFHPDDLAAYEAALVERARQRRAS